ncbi:MAG: TIGR02147 family protein [Desulfobacteraceae bacterium]|nr:MAG: TIGR02147 family protein [Desulfobacteraceae bacterium]
MERPSIFTYLDYRAFLNDMFLYKKGTTSSFSYRYFSKLAGFSSPNFLQLVVNGSRNLTNTSIAQVATGFKLKKPEREFFELLVLMNQASDHAEKDRYYRKMISLKAQGSLKKLETAQYEYFSKWYFPVLRELVMFGDRQQTPEQLAERLIPAATVKEVETALGRLADLGLIRKNEAGCWEQSDQIISTGPEVKSLLIANFHREMIQKGEESINRFPANERDITALTFSIKKSKIIELKQKIAAFRQEMLKEFASDEDADQVMQINIQAFPLTRQNSVERDRNKTHNKGNLP